MHLPRAETARVFYLFCDFLLDYHLIDGTRPQGYLSSVPSSNRLSGPKLDFYIVVHPVLLRRLFTDILLLFIRFLAKMFSSAVLVLPILGLVRGYDDKC